MARQTAPPALLEELLRCPERLSWHIAGSLPLADAGRQKLLEEVSTVCRLRREVRVMEGMDRVRCKTCQVSEEGWGAAGGVGGRLWVQGDGSISGQLSLWC